MINAHPQLKHAIELAKSGKKAEAIKLLSGILKEQPENEAAWLWMATCLKTNQQKLYCLNQALALNPQNQTTQNAIQKIKHSQRKPAEESDPPRKSTARPKSIVVPTHPVETKSEKPKYLIPGIILILSIIVIFTLLLIPKAEPALPENAIEALYLSNIDTGAQNDTQTYYILRFFEDGTVMGATIIGTADQVGDMWSVFIFQNKFTYGNKENFPFGVYQLSGDSPDGKLITFTLQYKYEGHPDFDQRIYSGYINDNETYLSECASDNINCTNRFYERINLESEIP
ncbi:MAG: tetratricopeptide repeat protein [Anaerolineaceae bacterium]|nr:tetratricopeptide repeat protein [Anaerolineaceae bacterium]